MSLHNLAHHVQSAGRGDDKVLVHMTPGEVKGLQSLAMAHGGSLTVNPETGLPEAGILKSLLPTLIGFGLAPFTGGLSAALITGAGYTAATGSLKKGLMAGLGAYGGAGLAQGLNTVGAQAASAGTGTGAAGVSNAAATTNMQLGNSYSTLAAPTTTTAANTATTAARGLSPEATAALKGGPYPYDIAAKSATPISRPFTDYMSQVGQGAKNVYAGGVEGLEALGTAMPKYSITGGLLGTAGTYGIEKQEEAEEEMRKRKDALNTGMIRPYTFDYGATNVAAEPYSGSAERTYFQPTYTAGTPYKAPGPEYAAKGGLMGLAAGGAVDNPRAVLAQAQQALSSKDPVQHMSEVNALGSNMGYPTANIKTPSYNVSRATPIPTNMVDPMGDTDVDPYTGAERFRSGGATKEPESSGYAYDYNPQTQQFTQTGGPGVSKMPTGKELAQGIGAQDAIKRFNEMAFMGKPYSFTPSWAGGTPTGTASDGVATPMTQPTTVGQPFAPTTVVPAYQTPEQQLGLGGFYDMMNQQMGGYGGYAAGGGVSHLGDYSDGGRLLKGPGDGVSDSIPASIGDRQPARLADGEFVVPARIVSELGNGSTQAGARKLYAMMDRVQNARKKSVGKKKVAVNSRADKYLPA